MSLMSKMVMSIGHFEFHWKWTTWFCLPKHKFLKSSLHRQKHPLSNKYHLPLMQIFFYNSNEMNSCNSAFQPVCDYVQPGPYCVIVIIVIIITIIIMWLCAPGPDGHWSGETDWGQGSPHIRCHKEGRWWNNKKDVPRCHPPTPPQYICIANFDQML